MIRILVRTDDAALAVNVGGAVNTSFKTFDVAIPELEAFLVEPYVHQRGFTQRWAIGIEVIGETNALQKT